MDRPNLISWVPASVRYDNRLKPNAKLLFSEITALTSKEGYCWAENAYFAELYDVSLETVSRWISQLRECGYIEVEILHNEGNKRRITLDEIVMTSRQKNQDLLTKKSRPLDKKSKPIYENNTINSTKNIYSETAYEFLEKNHPSALEVTLMKIKSSIPDFEDFKTYWNSRVKKDDLEFKVNVLTGSMELIAATWIKNLKKEGMASQNVPADASTQRRNLV